MDKCQWLHIQHQYLRRACFVRATGTHKINLRQLYPYLPNTNPRTHHLGSGNMSSTTRVKRKLNGVTHNDDVALPLTGKRAPSTMLRCDKDISEVKHIEKQGACFSILNVQQKITCIPNVPHKLPCIDYVTGAYLPTNAPIVAHVYPFVSDTTPAPASLLDLQADCISTYLQPRLQASIKSEPDHKYRPAWIKLVQYDVNYPLKDRLIQAEGCGPVNYWSVLSSQRAQNDLYNMQRHWYGLENDRKVKVTDLVAASHVAMRFMHAACTWGVGVPVCRHGNFVESGYHAKSPYELYIPGKQPEQANDHLKKIKLLGARSSVLRIPVAICTNHNFSPKQMTGLRFPQQDVKWLFACVAELSKEEVALPEQFESDVDKIIHTYTQMPSR